MSFFYFRKTDNFRCNVNGCFATFTSMASYDSHYNSNHRYTCIFCRKLLQSAHLLDLHLSEVHDNFFLACSAKKPMVYNNTFKINEKLKTILFLCNYSLNVLLKHVILSFGMQKNEIIIAWKFIKCPEISYNIMEQSKIF